MANRININYYIQLSLLILTKIILEISYVFYLVPLDKTYTYDFNLFSYINGWIWVLTIFSVIILEQGTNVSKALLFLHLYIGIVPMAIVYSFMDLSAVFFNSVCLMYFLVALVINKKSPYKLVHFVKPKLYSIFRIGVVGVSVLIIAIVVIYIVARNGIPQLTALNILDVYELRGKSVIENKYIGYLFSIVNYAIIPFLISYVIYQRKYWLVFILTGIVFALYMYTGNKTTLFSIGLVLAVAILGEKTGADRILMNLCSTCLITCCVLWMNFKLYLPYSLFVRRMLFLPAVIRFRYYDFFLNNPHIGFSGTIIGKITGENGNIYNGLILDESLPITIGRVYFDSPNMSANTGFLVEGFIRFGYFGFLVTGLFFIIFLKLVDYMQINTCYSFALGVSIYFTFSLNDLYLIDPMLFGPGLFIVILSIVLVLKNHNLEYGERINNEY